MASQTINWIPINDSTSDDQTVQYRIAPSGVWTTFSVVAKDVGTETITGLANNTIYEFRVVNNCSEGGPIPSAVVRAVSISCPVLDVTATSNSITVTFTPLGSSVNGYIIQLRNDAGGTILQTFTALSPFGSSVTHTFNTSITADTDYTVKVIPTADEFLKTDCTLIEITTDPEAEPSECGTPTDLTVS